MFTVKYIAPNGQETLSEHLAVLSDMVEGDGRPRVLVFDETPAYDKCNHAGVYARDGAFDPADISNARQQLMHHGIVYVMNRFGATVATYRL